MKYAILEHFTRNSQAEQPEDISGVCPSYTIPPKIFQEFVLATLFLLLAYQRLHIKHYPIYFTLLH